MINDLGFTEHRVIVLCLWRDLAVVRLLIMQKVKCRVYFASTGPANPPGAGPIARDRIAVPSRVQKRTCVPTLMGWDCSVSKHVVMYCFSSFM